MQLFDTHCHIQSAGLQTGERTTRELWAKAKDISVDQIVVRAYESGVETMVCVGCDLADSELAIETVQDRDGLYASIGLHPHEAQYYSGQPSKLNTFAALAAKEKVVAVGECGLDFFYTHSPKAAQIEVLEFQLDLAQKHQLPVIFHVREAFDDFWPIFSNFKGLRGVLHSYTDNLENMEHAVSNGLYIGVNGIATFSKQPEQLAMYAAIPDENLVLETDAPFLTPVPFRGTICEPKHVALTASFLAKLRGDTAEKLAETTTQNAKKLFNL
jgi:TatD DNase family protein